MLKMKRKKWEAGQRGAITTRKSDKKSEKVEKLRKEFSENSRKNSKSKKKLFLIKKLVHGIIHYLMSNYLLRLLWYSLLHF